MPHVQKLYERLKEEPDVLVLTMNVDEKPKLVKPFLEKNQYTFPTLFAHSYVRGTLQTKGIPRNWIVDRNGVFQLDKVGFVYGSGWLETLSENIEKVRRSL